jgi:divalent metal cation (Fe/Co/Zn/Cd) transporter
VSGRLARLLALAASAIGVLAAFAPAALAADGVGLWGRTDDKVVTYWGFGVMVFFTVLVIVLSLIQIRLESRKERLRAELERLRPPSAE